MQIERITKITPEVVESFKYLVPQLSTSSAIPGEQELAEIAANDALFIARDPELGGRIVGSLTLVTFRIPTGVRAWIEDVVVEESQRGKGIGEALTRAALDRAVELGSRTVDLTSRPSRGAANRLYQRVGFKLRESNLYRYTFNK
jgi:ribosomal protein S18 acetylase RimI-like enzyme